MPIVLSGGGSRGPYGAGALIALKAYRQEIAARSDCCWFGTSVGALNATMAAQGDMDKLVRLYATLKTKDVIGKNDSTLGTWGVFLSSKVKPFFQKDRAYRYFESKALRKTIEEFVNFEKIRNSQAHLLMCATNHRTGDLETFYISDLVEEFLRFEASESVEKRRLNHYHKIDSNSALVDALLACTAIPIYFSPVTIQDKTYIDGGIGNNTPTRQAAFFSRHVQTLKNGKIDRAFCVINDPEMFGENSDATQYDLTETIGRTIGILQNEIVRDSLDAWKRINVEVHDVAGRLLKISNILDRKLGLTEVSRDAVLSEISAVMRTSTSATDRSKIDLVPIRPKKQLPVTHILSFEPEKSISLMHMGVKDCVDALLERGLIDVAQGGRIARSSDDLLQSLCG